MIVKTRVLWCARTICWSRRRALEYSIVFLSQPKFNCSALVYNCHLSHSLFMIGLFSGACTCVFHFFSTCDFAVCFSQEITSSCYPFPNTTVGWRERTPTLCKTVRKAIHGRVEYSIQNVILTWELPAACIAIGLLSCFVIVTSVMHLVWHDPSVLGPMPSTGLPRHNYVLM